MVTLDGRVAGDKGREDRVVVGVSEEELIICDERWFCRWEERMGRRRRDGGQNNRRRHQVQLGACQGHE